MKKRNTAILYVFLTINFALIAYFFAIMWTVPYCLSSPDYSYNTLKVLILIVLPFLGLCFIRNFKMPECLLPWIGFVLLCSGVPSTPFPSHVLPVPGSLIASCLSILTAAQGIRSFRRYIS